MSEGKAPAPRWVLPALIVLSLATAAIMAVVLATTFVRIPLISNEGWSAIHARHALAGVNLYTPNGYGNFPNYPPLAFYSVAWLGALIGDMVYSGRALAITGMLIVALNVGILSRRLGASAPVAVLGAVMYVLLTLTVGRFYAGVSDPQFSGHALQTLGLVLLTRTLPTPSVPTLVSAALLMVLGGLFKNNLVVLPLAITLWLAMLDRRALLVWIAAGAAWLGLALAVCYAVFGEAVFAQVLGHERIYDPGIIPASFRWMTAYLLMAAIGIPSALRLGTPLARLMLIYFAVAVAIGLAFAGGVGVNLNTYFDVAIAAVPLATTVVPALPRMRRAWRIAVYVVAIGTPLYMVVFTARPFLARLENVWNVDKYDAALAMIAAADGPVYCREPTWCYWAGRDNHIDYSNAGQKLSAGPEAVAAFQAWVAANPPVLMQVPEGDGGFIVRSMGAFTANYVEVMSSPMQLLALRPAP